MGFTLATCDMIASLCPAEGSQGVGSEARPEWASNWLWSEPGAERRWTAVAWIGSSPEAEAAAAQQRISAESQDFPDTLPGHRGADSTGRSYFRRLITRSAFATSQASTSRQCCLRQGLQHVDKQLFSPGRSRPTSHMQMPAIIKVMSMISISLTI